ncbi:MAG TPA: protein kinase [Gemmatimonadales bacterium]|nr:protein kinase [Gemmatimonadales bacterium]
MKICPVCSAEYADDVRFCPNDGQTLRSSSPGTDLVGQVVADRYHVVKKLGEGGMGQVYLAEHVKMGRRSAIKVLSPSMVHDTEAVARFNREAANASRISHPNVCAIYDFGETPDGLIYLAMEFVEGEPLTDLLEQQGALPPERAVAIAQQVADALQAAHDLGIVHRDLKPDNIMITHGRDGSDVVKVVDFGIAKAVGRGDTQKVTKTGLVVGTPEFMSPEQLSGDPLDGRSDLYALGLVLFKMLTGKLPFEGSTVQDTMVKRLTDEPLTLADARPDRRFPPGLQATLDAALTRSPVDRYQSAAKFAHDLAVVLGVPRGPAAPLPPTRADAEAKTEALRRTTPIPSLHPRAVPKRRSRVPLVVGVVVILGGAGAALALRGSGKRVNGATPPDTAVSLAVDTGRARDTVSPRQPAAPPSRAPVKRPAPATVAHPGIDVTRARDLLDDLLLSLWPRNAAMVRDSARHIYNAPGIAPNDKARAAFVLGNAFFQLNDRAQGCRWVRTAMELDLADSTYGKLFAQCQR